MKMKACIIIDILKSKDCVIISNIGEQWLYVFQNLGKLVEPYGSEVNRSMSSEIR